MHHPARRRGARAAAAVGLLLALLFLGISSARGQAPTPRDSLPPDSLVAHDPPADTVAPDTAAVERADSIRGAMRRPADHHSLDPVEALEFPFKVVFYPVVEAGRIVAASSGLLSLHEPPAPVRGIRAAREWGMVPRVGTIGPNSGTALSLDLEAFPPFFLETGISVRGSQRHRTGVRLGDARVGGAVSYTFRRDAEDEFWGVGGNTPETQRSDFLRDKQEARVSVHARPLDFLRAEIGLAYEDNRVDRGFDDATPDIQDTFDPDSLVGLGERIEMGRLDLSTTVDLTERAGFRRRGFRVRLAGSFFRGVDGTTVDFHRLDHEVVGYLPLNSRQSLAVRGLVQMNRSGGGPGIPFYDLARFGGSTNGPRSFEGGRFRDRDAASLMTEWRYEIWEGPRARQRVEGFLLFDEAAVGPSLTELDGEDFHSSVGFGLRLLASDELVGLGYLAFGGGGPQFTVQLDWSF